MRGLNYDYPHVGTKRGGSNRARQFDHVIEGKRVTTMEVAAALGLSKKMAAARLKRGPFPLTWAGLRADLPA